MAWHEKGLCRFALLVFAAAVGYVLSEFGLVEYLFTTGGERYQDSVKLLMLGLPTFICLWFFRNHDIRTQIEKSEEQIQRSLNGTMERNLRALSRSR